MARSPIRPAEPAVLSGWEVEGARSAAPLTLADMSALAKTLVRAPAEGTLAGHADGGVEQGRPHELPVLPRGRVGPGGVGRRDGERLALVEAAAGQPGERAGAPVGPVELGAGVRDDLELAARCREDFRIDRIAQGGDQPVYP